jgi:hypothetical protein
MVNHFAVMALIVDLFIITPEYYLKNNSSVTEMLKNYTAGKAGLSIIFDERLKNVL